MSAVRGRSRISTPASPTARPRRRLTFNLSNDADPCLLGDGRLVFTSWQRCTLERGRTGLRRPVRREPRRNRLLAVRRKPGKSFKRMPCVTAKGMVVFVESDHGIRGRRRNIGRGDCPQAAPFLPADYQAIPMAGFAVLRRFPTAGSLSAAGADDQGLYGVYCLDPVSGEIRTALPRLSLSNDRGKADSPRAEPDGRSSNVQEGDPRGKFYCLDVYTSDLKQAGELVKGTAKRLRVLEGVPRKV